MAGTFYVLEAANLFCGDHDPTKSKHLTLAELKLPDLVEIMGDHHPGGSLLAIEVPLGVEKLEPTFKLNGFDPELLGTFGLGTPLKQTFTAYGVIRDQRTGKPYDSMATMHGRLSRIAPDNFTRGELMGHEYSIGAMDAYAVFFDGKPIIEWDFFANIYRLNGADANSDVSRILRIPGAA